MQTLYVHILVPVVAALTLNGLIFALGWNVGKAKKNPYLPPGYIIGIVWVIILGILGSLHYRLQEQKAFTVAYTIVALIIFCLLYPFLTSGLKSNTWSSVLNLATLVFAFSASLAIPRTEVAYMIPILLWATYVNVTQLLQPI